MSYNLPLVNDLHRHYPDAQIDWVVEEAYVSLLQLHPGIRRIIPYAQRRWRKHLGQASVRQEISGFIRTLRSESYDLILETQGLLKTGIILGLAKKAPGGRKIGLANGTAGSGYEGISRIFHDTSIATDPYTHAVDRGRLVAAKAIGKELDTPASFGLLPPTLEAPWKPAGGYIVFFHGTAGAAKKWARANWIALASELVSTGMPVLLPWGNEEEKKRPKRWQPLFRKQVYYQNSA
jgi:heptosyltransferase-1